MESPSSLYRLHMVPNIYLYLLKAGYIWPNKWHYSLLEVWGGGEMMTMGYSFAMIIRYLNQQEVP